MDVSDPMSETIKGLVSTYGPNNPAVVISSPFAKTTFVFQTLDDVNELIETLIDARNEVFDIPELEAMEEELADPITYGIWHKTTDAWMRDWNNNLQHFPSKAAARAQIRVWDEQAPRADYRICVIGPDGLPAEEGE